MARGLPGSAIRGRHGHRTGETDVDRADRDHTTPIARLEALVDQIVRESGEPTGFDSAAWVVAFLDAPSPALGGYPPREFMDTETGRTTVFQLVQQMQSGAYA